MAEKKLLNSLSKLGLTLFEPSEELDVNETLAEVVKSRDTRLWEAFPVLLANAGDNYQFDLEQVERVLSNKKQRDQLRRLLLLSLSLYTFNHLTFYWMGKLNKTLTNEEKLLVKSWRNNLVHNQTLTWGDLQLDAERLKKMFEMYFEQSGARSRRRKEKFEEFSLEYALSQVFSPKQKELFKKKLEGLPLTKTEQEYYSRSVKKKVVALANSELHSLSQKLLER